MTWVLKMAAKDDTIVELEDVENSLPNDQDSAAGTQALMKQLIAALERQAGTGASKFFYLVLSFCFLVCFIRCCPFHSHFECDIYGVLLLVRCRSSQNFVAFMCAIGAG